VNAINENQLAKLPGEEHVFKAITTSHPRMPAQAVQWAVEKLDRDASYEVTLKLKVRAQVMLLKQPFRDDTDKNGKPTKCPIEGLVNGSRGIITEFAHDGYPMVKFLNGPQHPVKICPTNWDSDAEKAEEKVSREQIPLRLAYALTIHKAQGASLDSALIDVGPSTFEYGQAYVALSRVRSLESLFIYEIAAKAFKAHPAVKEFYANVQEYVPSPVVDLTEPVEDLATLVARRSSEVQKSIRDFMPETVVPPCECGKTWTAQAFTDSNRRTHATSKKHVDFMNGKKCLIQEPDALTNSLSVI
jgi:hypothetical protein